MSLEPLRLSRAGPCGRGSVVRGAEIGYFPPFRRDHVDRRGEHRVGHARVDGEDAPGRVSDLGTIRTGVWTDARVRGALIVCCLSTLGRPVLRRGNVEYT